MMKILNKKGIKNEKQKPAILIPNRKNKRLVI